MHANANITCDRGETYDMFDVLLSLHPRSGSLGGVTREEQIESTAESIASRLPAVFDVEAVSMAFPVMYEESMNTVLVQECLRYNKLIAVMHSTLVELQKALVGQVVMSGELEELGDALFNQKVPSVWEARAFPSLKPLVAWTTELLDRVAFIATWSQKGPPAWFWISGFFFPQAFLTGTLQNFARKYQLPIDTLSFQFEVLDINSSGDAVLPAAPPSDGCFIHGLYLEGARWDSHSKVLAPSRPKELYVGMFHIIHRVAYASLVMQIYFPPCLTLAAGATPRSTNGGSVYVPRLQNCVEARLIVHNWALHQLRHVYRACFHGNRYR